MTEHKALRTNPYAEWLLMVFGREIICMVRPDEVRAISSYREAEIAAIYADMRDGRDHVFPD